MNTEHPNPFPATSRLAEAYERVRERANEARAASVATASVRGRLEEARRAFRQVQYRQHLPATQEDLDTLARAVKALHEEQQQLVGIERPFLERLRQAQRVLEELKADPAAVQEVNRLMTEERQRRFVESISPKNG